MKPQVILIVGNARAGTNWLGRCVMRSGIFTTIEAQAPFTLCHQSMIEPGYLPILADLYRDYARGRDAYCDKSHPNLWNAEGLAKLLSADYDLRFLAIERDVYASVASMKKHDGVRERVEDWQSIKVPWRYLGITPARYHWYCTASVVARLALRWRAHRDEVDRLMTRVDMLRVSYEDMVETPSAVGDSITSWLGRDVAITDIDPGHIQRKADLTTDDYADIEDALRV